MLNQLQTSPFGRLPGAAEGPLRRVTAFWLLGWDELAGGIHYWRVWHLLGVRELRHRYARSKLGQLWLMLSTAIMIVMLGAVWSLLWHQPVHDLMPFFGSGIILWTYLSQVLTECTQAFVNHSYLYRNQKMNFSVSIYSVIYKQTLTLAHSAIIIAALVVGFGVPINWYLLQIIPALALTWATMACTGYIIAMICVRYRDVVQVITTWIMVWFFITPVMWKPEQLPKQYNFIVDLNPLAIFLELLRSPLLGQPVRPLVWLSTILITVVGGVMAIALIGRYKRRIILWM